MRNKKRNIIYLKDENKLDVLLTTSFLSKNVRTCNKLNKNEWAGGIFYHKEYKNSLLNRIEIFDMLPCSYQDAAFVDLSDDDDKKIKEYYFKEKYHTHANIGSIHSHVNMSVFFSGTDSNTFYEHGNAEEFLMIVTNNNNDFYGRFSQIVVDKETGVKYVIERELNFIYEYDKVPEDFDKLLDDIYQEAKERKKLAKQKQKNAIRVIPFDDAYTIPDKSFPPGNNMESLFKPDENKEINLKVGKANTETEKLLKEYEIYDFLTDNFYIEDFKTGIDYSIVKNYFDIISLTLTIELDDLLEFFDEGIITELKYSNSLVKSCLTNVTKSLRKYFSDKFIKHLINNILEFLNIKK